MLKKFDIFVENVITEGRKTDESKKFKINREKVLKHVNAIHDSHEYKHDKGHFASIADEIDYDSVYTPKNLRNHVSTIMKKKRKHDIADGYGRLFHAFLRDQHDSPFEDHDEGENESENNEQDDSSYESDSPEGTHSPDSFQSALASGGEGE
jgi:hypothetical protein